MKLNDEILWDLIDGELTPNEEKEVRQVIEKDPHWKERYDSLLTMHKTIGSGIRPSSPSIHFTDNVMEVLHHANAVRARKGLNVRNINLKGLLLTIAGIVIGAIILSQGILDFSLLDYSTLTADKLQTPYVDATPVMDILGSDLLVKSFLFFDAILAIFLVERFLFRPMARH